MAQTIKSILDLKPQVREYTLVNPSTGDEFVMALRELLPSDIAVINASIRYPKPPVKDFKKGGEPIFDDEDPKYKESFQKANQEYIFRWLLVSWEVDIPGDTPDEKLESLKNNLPNWAFREIEQTLQEVNGYKPSDVAYAKKNSKATTGDT